MIRPIPRILKAYKKRFKKIKWIAEEFLYLKYSAYHYPFLKNVIGMKIQRFKKNFWTSL